MRIFSGGPGITNEMHGSLQQAPDKPRAGPSAFPRRRRELLLKYQINEKGRELEAACVCEHIPTVSPHM